MRNRLVPVSVHGVCTTRSANSSSGATFTTSLPLFPSLDTPAAFDSVVWPALWCCLQSNMVPGQYTTILRAVYNYVSGRVCA
ncbi:unnamed protein product [Dicrocoelium dendriticum]|nr:unnamed protein product [Dicrocoelium dendriticum]